MRAYLAALTEPDALHAIRLTLLTAAVAVPLGTRLRRGRRLGHRQVRFRRQEPADHADRSAVLRLAGHRRADVRAAVRPVRLSGAVAVAHDIRIIFAVPGIIAGDAVRHVSLRRPRVDPADAGPGTEEEEAARVLGAGGWQIFWRVTLPNIKWGLLYGVILCNARAMGEFGAVSVVSATSAA